MKYGWRFGECLYSLLRVIWFILTDLYVCMSWGSLASINTRLRTGHPEFNSQKCQWWNFLSSPHCPDQLWSPPSLLIGLIKGALPSGMKRPGRKADLSLPHNAEVKNVWSYISTPQCIFVAWYLVKHRDFTFSLPVSVMITNHRKRAELCPEMACISNISLP
jgi:hypothetical protein